MDISFNQKPIENLQKSLRVAAIPSFGAAKAHLKKSIESSVMKERFSFQVSVYFSK